VLNIGVVIENIPLSCGFLGSNTQSPSWVNVIESGEAIGKYICVFVEYDKNNNTSF
jgi:hypothetical protein